MKNYNIETKEKGNYWIQAKNNLELMKLLNGFTHIIGDVVRVTDPKGGNIVERYIDTERLKECKLKEPFDWSGKKVYLGLDLSQTTDLTAVSMVHYDREKGGIYAKAWGFLPNNAIDRKSRKERINYRQIVDKGEAFACGEDVIDYGFVEAFILNLEDKYGVQIMDLGYDRFNAISTISKLSSNGIRCTEVPQISRYLNSPIKLLEESILNKTFKYEPSQLLEVNFANCKVQYDTNLRKYLHKKKSTNQMIDLVVAMVNALKILEEEEISKPEFFVYSF